MRETNPDAATACWDELAPWGCAHNILDCNLNWPERIDSISTDWAWWLGAAETYHPAPNISTEGVQATIAAWPYK
jgi:hypothetical protein